MSEYPPRDDAAGFVEHHYRRFTGYIATAVCGADRFKSPKSVWEEWIVSKEEAIAAAEQRRGQRIPAIEAGHYWEESICRLAALCLYEEEFAAGRLCIRAAGPVPDSSSHDMRATADALLCAPDGSLVWPPVVIEAKYSTRSFPQRPHVAHLFQLQHQMHVLRARSIFIAYGHGLGATEANGYRDARLFRVRVFRVLFSDRLWAWMTERRNIFRDLVHRRVEPSERSGLPPLHESFERYWVQGIRDESGTLPPEPKWTLACESQSLSQDQLGKLPRRLPAVPTLPDV